MGLKCETQRFQILKENYPIHVINEVDNRRWIYKVYSKRFNKWVILDVFSDQEVMDGLYSSYIRERIRDKKAFLEFIDVRTFKDLQKRRVGHKAETYEKAFNESFVFGKDFDRAFDDLKMAVVLDGKAHKTEDGVFTFIDHVMTFTPFWMFAPRMKVEVPYDMPMSIALIDLAIDVCTIRRMLKIDQDRKLREGCFG